ncbi:hypothetical protein DM02DRAFT_721699 [Periconia macrospinosa]|uniref:LicD/FKTN/FKRP nucleotidyltransferase domain-containing protein n=1 Tax=Periconia macrospinosa TaxID=97972 RepID=A0A2V1D614_9PLEO|nr:hypothetical protein DM02DRAFT_721699 [Periconia macrospinosa]
MHSYFNTFLFFALMAAVQTIAYPSASSLYNPDSPSKGRHHRANDIAFLEGLTNNDQDMSGREGDDPEKYFHESIFHAHYDGRFAYQTLPDKTRLPHLRALVRSYLATMHDLGAETWIMHGSLLGWWWNQRIMPWDDDIDVQVSEPAIEFLASYHNMTVHSFAASDLDISDPDEVELMHSGKRYLLEVNPHYANPSTDDWQNVIDARWIDIDTGLFIDITTVRVNRTAEGTMGRPKGSAYRYPEPPQHLYCKDEHTFWSTQIFPLRTAVFEGVPVRIPYKYQELLAEEYGESALTEREFLVEKHFFDQAKMERKTSKRGSISPSFHLRNFLKRGY